MQRVSNALGDDFFERVFDGEGYSMLVSKLRAFGDCESGATSIEYALIGGIVSIAIVTGLMGIKTWLVAAFQSVAAGFEGAGP